MEFITAENYLCFYSLFEMILRDMGRNKWSQYSLANIFGVVLPNGEKIPNVDNVIYDDNEAMCGAHIDCNMINDFFKKESIALQINYVKANPYGVYNIDNEIMKDKYCIYAYSYGALYDEVLNINVGHTSLFLRDVNQEEIEIFDPGPRNAGRKVVKKYKMYDAMYDSKGGIYFFEKCR